MNFFYLNFKYATSILENHVKYNYTVLLIACVILFIYYIFLLSLIFMKGPNNIGWHSNNLSVRLLTVFNC